MSKVMRTAQVFGFAMILTVAMAMPAFTAETATYSYDNLGRLTTVTFTNGTTIIYTYDAAGNRTNVTVTCGGSGC